MSNSSQQATRTPFICLKEVCLTLPSIAQNVDILRHVNLDIAQGESVSIVGASGAGKSSLLMVLAGMERPTQGTVTVGGEDITGMNEDQLASFRLRTMGIVFQSFNLMPSMTAVENVALPLQLSMEENVMERAATALRAVGLQDRLHHIPTQLSGGEQQRVAIARATICEPKLLLADEPTGNLDSASGTRVMDLIFSLHESLPTTLVLVSHDKAVAKMCARQITLHDGKVVAPQRNGS